MNPKPEYMKWYRKKPIWFFTLYQKEPTWFFTLYQKEPNWFFTLYQKKPYLRSAVFYYVPKKPIWWFSCTKKNRFCDFHVPKKPDLSISCTKKTRFIHFMYQKNPICPISCTKKNQWPELWFFTLYQKEPIWFFTLYQKEPTWFFTLYHKKPVMVLFGISKFLRMVFFGIHMYMRKFGDVAYAHNSNAVMSLDRLMGTRKHRCCNTHECIIMRARYFVECVRIWGKGIGRRSFDKKYYVRITLIGMTVWNVESGACEQEAAAPATDIQFFRKPNILYKRLLNTHTHTVWEKFNVWWRSAAYRKHKVPISAVREWQMPSCFARRFVLSCDIFFARR